MGVFEESKIRLSDLQKRIDRVRKAGDVLTETPNDKTAKTRFRMMYATVSRLQEEFEAQLAIISKQLGKPDSKSEDDLTLTEAMRERFDEAYFSVMIVADEYIPTIQQHSRADDTFIDPSFSRQPTKLIPLEKLSIPHFKGDVKEYTSFRNLFDTVVHDNSDIRPVVKFSYLKAYLEGEPLKLITNLTLSDENYELALKTLDNRYSNRRIIAQSHFNQLWEMPKAIFGDAKSIRQMLNTIVEAVGALKNQKYAADQWDPILLHLFEMKMDTPLRAQWELLVDHDDDPNVKDFVTFLTKYCNVASAGQSGSGREKATKKPFGKTTVLHAAKTDHREPKKQFTCQVCKATPGHLLIACPVFKKKTPQDRYEVLKELRRCFLCFSEHTVSQCKHTRLCSECNGRHHSLLHFKTTIDTPPTTTIHTMFSSAQKGPPQYCVLMATIAVLVQDSKGHYQEFRALLDSGSQSSFMTEHCRNRLKLTWDKCSVFVQAMAGMQVPPIKARSKVILKPLKHDTPQLTVETFILPRIIGLIPSERVLKTEWPHVQGLDLADPRYNESLPVDILLGADVFPYIISGDRREGTNNQPVALKTVFGWTLMGRSTPMGSNTTTSLFTSIDPVETILRKFWEIEELPTASKTSPSEQECEEIYRSTTTRQSDGRYIVHLPFTQYPPPIGDSRHLAL